VNKTDGGSTFFNHYDLVVQPKKWLGINLTSWLYACT